MFRSNAPLLLLAALAAFNVALAADSARVCAADPYADPANDPCNILKYIPNLGANAVASVLYFLTAIALTYQQFRHRARWMLVLTIGAWAEGVGIALRLYYRQKPQVTSSYIAMNTVVVLSPCLFLAADYILLGRLVAYIEGSEYIRPLKPRLVSTVFVCSDVLTFLIQGSGGGLAASGSQSSADLGSKLFLIGLALQLVSFALFTCLWAVVGWRIKRNDPYLWRNTSGWKKVYWSLGFTCIFYLIRSFFRTIELADGFTGYLTTHEIYYLLLDALPLFIGITTFVPFWPGKYIVHGTVFQSIPLQERGGSNTNTGVNAVGYGGGNRSGELSPLDNKQ
ncbi:hypothetical protein I317_07557 [Kwoniella heveanensis CBS 569]|uniref:Integral membrane protein n=1 Tax=Kwoniella heveanensis BCC8398 TaxID=1296120 RepID=A0A1B9GJ59_9TREE|nr:hypothetical protein I316_07254 [Kwoniella heveanensis BCC8398]OCF38659.1 hypothetical protein I317_07557 [Kwoniella heveanensis CBS 569]